jgi:hypothetical protein
MDSNNRNKSTLEDFGKCINCKILPLHNMHDCLFGAILQLPCLPPLDTPLLFKLEEKLGLPKLQSPPCDKFQNGFHIQTPLE